MRAVALAATATRAGQQRSAAQARHGVRAMRRSQARHATAATQSGGARAVLARHAVAPTPLLSFGEPYSRLPSLQRLLNRLLT